MRVTPKTVLGWASVGMNAFFLAFIAVSVVIASVMRLLSYGDTWWDAGVGLLALVTLAALAAGTISVAFRKERSLLVFLSLAVSACAVLFALTHSLFISD